jgi:hypothetical protein
MMNKFRILNLARRVSHEELLNSYALAFILTEMKFRGPFFRFCEIIYSIWLIYFLGREPKITLGKCQVSFPYWRKRFKNNLLLFLATFDDIENYEICCDYLNQNPQSSLKKMIIGYTGWPSVMYVRHFNKHVALINSTIRHSRFRKLASF